MKYFWIVAVLLFFQEARAQTITITDVRVSVRSDSAASAREQALNRAHELAFQKLVRENFPEHVISLPSQNILSNMVNDFSIDREKSTPTSYTASLTFQFDEPQIMAWVQKTPLNAQNDPTVPRGLQSNGIGRSLRILASYGTHGEWLHIRKALENSAGVQNLSIFTLSPKNANLEIYYRGPIDQLEQTLLQKDILLSQQDDNWVIALNKQILP